MAVFQGGEYGWLRIEGSTVPNLGEKYGVLTNLSRANIFCGTPEIRIYNELSVINGSKYIVVPLSTAELGGYTSIKDIDTNWESIKESVKNYADALPLDASGVQYYYEPFSIKESSAIIYADTTSTCWNLYPIVLVDKEVEPAVVTITAKYIGNPVPISEAFDTNKLTVTVIYDTGGSNIVKSGYTISPDDRIVTKIGSNVFSVTYISGGTSYMCSVAITGTKSLQAISAVYDGPNIPYGQKMQRKYIVVTGTYSDGSSSTISDFTFPDGDTITETNYSSFRVQYNGFYASMSIPVYTVTSSRIIAYYNGPNIEIGNEIDTSYCKIKIYYSASTGTDSYYEDIEPSSCTFKNTTIEHEGLNYVTVLYESKTGSVTTSMAVVGIKPEVTLNFIEAFYTGPDIIQGKSFSPERVVCKAHYSDGSIVSVKGFFIESTIVSSIGLNNFKITYKEKDVSVETYFSVIGIEKDSTTGTGYSPISIDNNYPEATRNNNRYRGPAEARKHDETNMFIYKNIHKLYEIFTSIENDFNNHVDIISSKDNIKARTFDTIKHIEDISRSWINDSRFSSGAYILKEETE